MSNIVAREITPLEWTGEALRMLVQTRLSHDRTYIEARRWEEVGRAIRTMQVRGAPAIGAAGAYAVALAVHPGSAEGAMGRLS